MFTLGWEGEAGLLHLVGTSGRTRRTLISPFTAGSDPHYLKNLHFLETTCLDIPCRVDGVKVHGLTVLLAPLLPMVSEARVLQSGEGRLNITLDGVASKALVNVMSLLLTGILCGVSGNGCLKLASGALDVAEEDQEALFEVAEMLQVSYLIKALNRTGRLDDEDDNGLRLKRLRPQSTICLLFANQQI